MITDPNLYPVHDSQRGWFARALYFEMAKNPDIYMIAADLGFGMLDHIRDDFPDRYVNVGAAEQSMLGAAIGMAQCGKIPFCYSITSFLLGRPFEWIRNYLEHEGAPVRMVGDGLDYDYQHDGITHHSADCKKIMALFPKIRCYFPETKEQVPGFVAAMVAQNSPSLLVVRR